jgi:triacylglycerol lipase
MAMENGSGFGSDGLLLPTWKNLFYPPERNQYQYFAHAATYPFPATGAAPEQRYRVKAAWAADAAMLSYAHSGEQAMLFDEVKALVKDAGMTVCEQVGEWTRHGTQGFFASNNDFAILAFRGTERDDPDDVAMDAEAGMNLEADIAAKTGVEQHSTFLHSLFQAVKSRLDPGGCWVHFGFQRALNQVWEQVSEMINRYRHDHPNAEICFTGHSLGAALATLAVSRFSGGSASLYTFGSPRTGNSTFCDRVRQRADRGVYRFVNGADLVTHVPIEAPFYHHIESLAYLLGPDGELSRSEYKAAVDFGDLLDMMKQLPWRGDFLDLNAEPPAQLVDHSPARYCMKLQKGLAGVLMGKPASSER